MIVAAHRTRTVALAVMVLLLAGSAAFAQKPAKPKKVDTFGDSQLFAAYRHAQNDRSACKVAVDLPRLFLHDRFFSVAGKDHRGSCYRQRGPYVYS